MALTAPKSTPPSASGHNAIGDGAFFRSVVDVMREGEPYYPAMGSMLRRHGYPAASVFNWRTPLLYTGLAAFPSWEWGRALLVLLAAGAAVAVAVLAAGRSPLALAVTVVLASGVVVMMSAPASVGMTEPWSGSLIALSLWGYARDRPMVGFACGLAALFVRELAAPYVGLCAFIAARRRRRGELTGWLIGSATYALFYWIHWSHVADARLPTDLQHAGSWLAWGGFPFLLSTVNWHGWLLLMPWAATAISLTLVAAGVFSPTAPCRLRLVAGGYAAVFLAVGQVFNEYWGFLVWPTWCLASGYGAQQLLDDGRVVARGLARPPRS
jgi:hypothetical protein